MNHKHAFFLLFFLSIIHLPIKTGPLHDAARKNNLNLLKGGLQEGKPINNNNHDLGFTPLHSAAASGSYECLVHLIKKKASINPQDDDNRTPLFWAASQEHYLCVAELLISGADPLIPDFRGNSPLHIAAEKGNAYATIAFVWYFLCKKKYTWETFEKYINLRNKHQDTALTITLGMFSEKKDTQANLYRFITTLLMNKEFAYKQAKIFDDWLKEQ